MAAYLAMRIMDGKMSYKAAVKYKKGRYKEEIDEILILEGREDLIERD